MRTLRPERGIIEDGVDVVGFHDEVFEGGVGGGEDMGCEDKGTGATDLVILCFCGGESVCEEREEGEEDGWETHSLFLSFFSPSFLFGEFTDGVAGRCSSAEETGIFWECSVLSERKKFSVMGDGRGSLYRIF